MCSKHMKIDIFLVLYKNIWAAISENVPSNISPNADSEQPMCLCMIKIFTGHTFDSQGCKVSS